MIRVVARAAASENPRTYQRVNRPSKQGVPRAATTTSVTLVPWKQPTERQAPASTRAPGRRPHHQIQIRPRLSWSEQARGFASRDPQGHLAPRGAAKNAATRWRIRSRTPWQKRPRRKGRNPLAAPRRQACRGRRVGSHRWPGPWQEHLAEGATRRECRARSLATAFLPIGSPNSRKSRLHGRLSQATRPQPPADGFRRAGFLETPQDGGGLICRTIACQFRMLEFNNVIFTSFLLALPDCAHVRRESAMTDHHPRPRSRYGHAAAAFWQRPCGPAEKPARRPSMRRSRSDHGSRVEACLGSARSVLNA